MSNESYMTEIRELLEAQNEILSQILAKLGSIETHADDSAGLLVSIDSSIQ